MTEFLDIVLVLLTARTAGRHSLYHGADLASNGLREMRQNGKLTQVQLETKFMFEKNRTQAIDVYHLLCEFDP